MNEYLMSSHFIWDLILGINGVIVAGIVLSKVFHKKPIQWSELGLKLKERIASCRNFGHSPYGQGVQSGFNYTQVCFITWGYGCDDITLDHSSIKINLINQNLKN